MLIIPRAAEGSEANGRDFEHGEVRWVCILRAVSEGGEATGSGGECLGKEGDLEGHEGGWTL